MSYGTNAPWGLQPVRYMNGAAWNDQTNQYLLPSGYNTNLFRGDPVTAAAAATGKLSIATAGDGNAILGVFWAVQYIDNTTGQLITSPTWTANTVTKGAADATVFVIDDPMTVFNVQGDGNGAVGITTAALLRNASLVAGAGSAYSGQSGWMLSQALIGAGATKQVKILRFVPAVSGTNVSGLTFNNVEVIINNSYYKAGVASV